MTWLRAVAAAIALAALVDPAIPLRRPTPLPVVIVAAPASAGSPADTSALAALVRQRLAPVAAFETGQPPAAVIAIGRPAASERIPDGTPLAAIDPAASTAPNVAVARVPPPPPVLPGEQVRIAAEIVGSGVAGQSSTIALEQAGVTLARIEHRWSSQQDRFRAELRYAPPSPGVIRLRLVARPLPGETNERDNAVDLALAVTARTLRVLVHEPRPSWAATFVRRALEADPVFAVASLTAPSRGPLVTAGAPPSRLTAGDLETFDAVVVGAPDALAVSEIAALDAFARVRGGGVILLPDRRPSGSYLSLLPAIAFDEILLDRPAALEGEGALGVHAAELAAAADTGRGGTALATIVQGTARRAVVFSLPRGAGRVVFSGALDSWRYRARDEDGFARFWTSVVAGLAAAAPARIAVRLDPPLAAPGDRVTVRVAVRSTELTREADRIATPPVDVRIIGPDGSERPIRVWPASEAGVFVGQIDAPAAGRYDVRASLSGKAAADAPLVVADSAVSALSDDGAVLRWAATMTGGVTAGPAEIDRLVSWVRALPRPDVAVRVHPMRSPWWMIPFAACLSAAWALGRWRGWQ